jgi:EF hand
MKARQISCVLLLAGCVSSRSPQMASATEQQDSGLPAGARERQMRFGDMDRDGDGVITRAEWRGNAQSFREHDKNQDGVLSGEEIWVQRRRGAAAATAFDRADRNRDGAVSRSEWWGDAALFDRLDRNNDGVLGPLEFQSEEASQSGSARASFVSLDRNGNGVITNSEWIGRAEDFRALDTDNDGVLTPAEYRRQGDEVIDSPAYRAGRDRGLADGRQAGREDKQVNGGKWDLDGQRELETADAGYNVGMGSRADYQAGYRAGFRGGYREGFGPR